LDVQEHVLSKYALGRIGVVGTTGGVDVVVGGIEKKKGGVDPAFELHVNRGLTLLGNSHLALKLAIFRAAAITHDELTGRQQHGAAVMAIDLLLEEKVGGEALGLRRIDMARFVAEGEAASGRPAVHVNN